MIFSGHMPSSGSAGSYGSFTSSFVCVCVCVCLRNLHTILEWFYQFTFPSTVQEGCLFFTSLPAFIACRFFDDDHSDQSEVLSQCSFDVHFFNNE